MPTLPVSFYVQNYPNVWFLQVSVDNQVDQELECSKGLPPSAYQEPRVFARYIYHRSPGLIVESASEGGQGLDSRCREDLIERIHCEGGGAL